MARISQHGASHRALSPAAVLYVDSARQGLDVSAGHLLKPQGNDGAPYPALSPSSAPSMTSGPMKAAEQHILIVDDEADIRMMLRFLLEDEGYTVGEAVDGLDGLAQLRASPRRLVVLLDYMMPQMSGAELLTAILADSQLANQHAIIFVTANLAAFSPELLQVLQTEGIPVVQKPFRLEAILEVIERASVRLRSAADVPESQRRRAP